MKFREALSKVFCKPTNLTKIIVACIGFLSPIIVAVIGIITILPRFPIGETTSEVLVYANKYPFESTDIYIEKGDEVWIYVERDDNTWRCWPTVATTRSEKIIEGEVFADGVPDDKRDGFTSPVANYCELIGYVKDEKPENIFRVGTFTKFTAETNGTLYFGANDDYACVVNESRNYHDSSCTNGKFSNYLDNSGAILVKITIFEN